MREIIVLAFFCLFGFSALVGAVFILASKNLLYCLYAFLLTMLSVAGIFVIVGADFVGVSQLMIYVGGILVLFLFGIMLGPAKSNRKELLRVKGGGKVSSFLVSILLFVSLLSLQKSFISSSLLQPNLEHNTVNILGLNLLTDYLLVLELLGLLLLMALVASTFLAAKK